MIFLLRKSDIAPDGRSDILFAFETSNARSAYHCRRQYHARSAYHSPQANRVSAPALSQVRQRVLFYFLVMVKWPFATIIFGSFLGAGVILAGMLLLFLGKSLIFLSAFTIGL